MAKDKRDFKTMDLAGIPKVPGRPNLGLTKSSTDYKRLQREQIRIDALNGILTTRSHCMYVLSKPVYFSKAQRENAWIRLAELDGYAPELLKFI
ncbi:hypothetical protein [Aquirhabdus parva]|uniref:Uncharacterized protein n=1 Tax=Aquirhabdus parva TaxID=2283318 RepID=A0A345P707_9GAMM|nr:hypothetical protein [Aquirhabdus parva]AXI03066.1 hypothetical protein HYN46_09575 [Aquirhabdus parva]